MKNITKIGFLSLFVFITNISIWAQSEGDFQVTLTADNRGVVIARYTGTIREVVIPATIQGMPVREIGYDAFVDPLVGFSRVDRRITRIIIPEGVTKIGSQAFRALNSLVSITLPSTLIEIGSSAFADLPLLTSIELPAGLRVIGSNAFSRCILLTSISLPSGLTEIGANAFEGSALSVFPNPWPVGVTTIQARMFENTNLTSVVIPEGITFIGSSAFARCRSLTRITLPSTINTIDTNAFANSSITSIEIPETVTSIRYGYGAFQYLSRLNLASQARIRELNYSDRF